MIPKTTKSKSRLKFKPKLNSTNQAKSTHRGDANGDLFLTAVTK